MKKLHKSYSIAQQRVINRHANTVSDKYLEVFIPLPQKYSIEITGNNFELYCNDNFVYANTCLEQIFVIYGRLLDGILRS
tara:strand:+ start:241 stop:480 length:240 start_codon:yes stop_codon:yes gene_type:complete